MLSRAKLLAPAFGILLIGLFPALAAGLELGDIRVKSSLQQALKAEIDIEDVTPAEMAELRVSLAKPALFERMQLEFTPLLNQLRFHIGRTNAGGYKIFVSTEQPVNEPFLDFLLEVQWAKGRLTREFIVLLDPPTFLQQKPSPIDAPLARSNPREAVSRTLSDNTSGGQPVPRANAHQSSIVYGEVKRGETLWRIADKVRPDHITTEQMMLALLRDNPQAFSGGNVNRLKQGAVLRVNDPSSLGDIDHDEAVKEAAKQYRQWLGGLPPRKSRLKAIASENESSKVERTPVVESPSPRPQQAHLKLVSPEAKITAAEQGVSSAKGESLQKLQDELALANEATAVARQENQELSQRLASLQEQMSQMQHLLELKTQELERVQSRPDAPSSPKPESPVAVELAGSKPVNVPAVHPAESKQPDYQPFWQDPYLLGIITSAVFLVFFMAWLLIRSRRQSNEPDPLAMEIAREHDHAHAGDQIGLEPLTEMIHDDSLWVNESEIDPLIEADLYLLYERFDKAEELLKAAIEADPTRNELKLKLLETVCKEQNLERFESMAEEFYAVLKGDEQQPLWRQVIGFARELGSDNPMFADKSEPLEGKGQEHGEDSLFVQEDEMGSQLDLAKAYIEMGDIAGAEALLNKVLVTGTDDQKEQAMILKNTLR